MSFGISQMKAKEYRQLRETMGSVPEVAAMLGLTPNGLYAREAGKCSIDREAEFALRWCQMHHALFSADSEYFLPIPAKSIAALLQLKRKNQTAHGKAAGAAS